MFHSPALDALVATALQHNPTLAAAQASLREAQENYAADAGGRLYPSVSAQLSGQRQRTASAQAGVPAGTVYNVFAASVDVSYTLDLFGANKRELEGLAAQVDYQRFQVAASYLSLTANVVATAIQEASLRAQLAATREVVERNRGRWT